MSAQATKAALLAQAEEDESWVSFLLRVTKRPSERNEIAMADWLVRAALLRARVMNMPDDAPDAR